MIIGFDVDGQFVTRRDDERVVNRSVNYLELCFNFKDTETWDDLTKRVLFKGNSETYSKQLDNENKVVVPSEVLTGDSFVFTLYGITDDDPVVRVTCNLMKITMVSSGFTGDSLVPGPGNRSVIDDVYARLDGLDVTVGGHTTALSNLGDDVNGLGDSVDTLEDTVSRHTGSINDLTGTVNGHTRSINSLTGSVSALSTNVNAISDDVDSLETVVNGHTNSINSLTGDVNRIDGTVTDLSDTVGEHTTTLSNLGDDVTGLSNGLDALGDDVDNLESTVNGIGDDITAINGKLNNTVEMTVEYTNGTSETFDVVVK